MACTPNKYVIVGYFYLFIRQNTFITPVSSQHLMVEFRSYLLLQNWISIFKLFPIWELLFVLRILLHQKLHVFQFFKKSNAYSGSMPLLNFHKNLCYDYCMYRCLNFKFTKLHECSKTLLMKSQSRIRIKGFNWIYFTCKYLSFATDLLKHSTLGNLWNESRPRSILLPNSKWIESSFGIFSK